MGARAAARVRRTATLLALALLVPLGAVVTESTAAAPAGGKNPTVIGRKLVSTSVDGRKVWAYRIGEPARRNVPRVLVMSTMHGNEPATRQIVRSLVDGPPVVGVDLWLLPTYNPDGLAAGTRQNAHGVDLNRNFPYKWADLDGSYESGPKPASEPETRGMMRFLRWLEPKRIISFHQPLNGVDLDTKSPAFARRVSEALRLPAKTFDCGGVCHGTMTGWFNHHFDGTAMTVEYGPSPSTKRMTKRAPRQLLRLFGARHGAYDVG